MRPLTLALLALLLLAGCSSSSHGCEAELNALSSDFSAATREIDLSCGRDDDCVVVDSDLPCLETSCWPVINKKDAAKYAGIRDSFSSRCARTNCHGSADCFESPIAPRCRNGFCSNHLLPDGG